MVVKTRSKTGAGVIDKRKMVEYDSVGKFLKKHLEPVLERKKYLQDIVEEQEPELDL